MILIKENFYLALWISLLGKAFQYGVDQRSKLVIKRMRRYYPDIYLIIIGAKEYMALKKIMMVSISDWEFDSKGR